MKNFSSNPPKEVVIMVEKLDLLDRPSSKILTFLTKNFDLMLEILTHANLPKEFFTSKLFQLDENTSNSLTKCESFHKNILVELGFAFAFSAFKKLVKITVPLIRLP